MELELHYFLVGYAGSSFDAQEVNAVGVTVHIESAVVLTVHLSFFAVNHATVDRNKLNAYRAYGVDKKWTLQVQATSIKLNITISNFQSYC